MARADWPSLPTDVLYILIAEHLPWSDLPSLLNVCPSWRAFIIRTILHPSTRMKALAYETGDRSLHLELREPLEYIFDEKFSRSSGILRHPGVKRLDAGVKVHKIFREMCIRNPEEDAIPRLKEGGVLEEAFGEDVEEALVDFMGDSLFEPPIVGRKVIVRVRYTYSYLGVQEDAMSDNDDTPEENMVLCDDGSGDYCVFGQFHRDERRRAAYEPAEFKPEEYDFGPLSGLNFTGWCYCTENPSNDRHAQPLSVVFKLNARGDVITVGDLVAQLECSMRNVWKCEENLTVTSILLSVNPRGWLDVKLVVELLATKEDAAEWEPCEFSFAPPVEFKDEEDEEEERDEEDSKYDSDSERWSDSDAPSEEETDEHLAWETENLGKLYPGFVMSMPTAIGPAADIKKMEKFFPGRMYDHGRYLAHMVTW